MGDTIYYLPGGSLRTLSAQGSRVIVDATGDYADFLGGSMFEEDVARDHNIVTFYKDRTATECPMNADACGCSCGDDPRGSCSPPAPTRPPGGPPPSGGSPSGGGPAPSPRRV